MKRGLLVADYGSSDESDAGPSLSTKKSDSAGDAIDARPLKKKLKSLPALSPSVIVAVPIDDPALHQGRRRTKPHVDGQFAAHVYVPVALSNKAAVLLRDVVETARVAIPELHSFLDGPAGSKATGTLHVSLSRPVFLRAHQRDAFRAAVKTAAKVQAPFEISCAKLTTLVNDENTRIFLSVELGAGHSELKGLSDSLTPYLNSLRQTAYYDAPRFHFSIAWALLSSRTKMDIGTEVAADLDTETTGGVPPSAPAVSEFPQSLLDDLTATYGDGIRTSGHFTVETMEVKIGKAVSSFKLQTRRKATQTVS